MDSYDSDDSLSDAGSGTSTNVLLGYASKAPTDDSISQLGGVPTWLDATQHPSPLLAQCKCCSGYLSLLLQLNGDLPDRFPNHERRLYIWGCKRKACRRKPGSIRAVRAVRSLESQNRGQKNVTDQNSSYTTEGNSKTQSKADIGSALFGGQIQGTSNGGGNPFSSGISQNPFSMSSSTNTFSPSSSSNPFAAPPAPTSSLAGKPPQRPIGPPTDAMTNLHTTFAAKASISAPPTSPPPAPKPQPATLPWPQPDQLPKPYPQFYLDADYEYLENDTSSKPSTSHAAFMDVDTEGNGGGNSKTVEKEDSDLYESAHDKTFDRFADIMAQNPYQVLRYEFGGSPLLYSRADEVGRLFTASPSTGSSKITTAAAAGQPTTSRIPKCGNCGAARVFEMQLTPHAIVELEAEEDAATLLAEGMEWGSIILGVCSRDCGSGDGTVDYVEEWAGVQWEEVVSRGGGGR